MTGKVGLLSKAFLLLSRVLALMRWAESPHYASVTVSHYFCFICLQQLYNWDSYFISLGLLVDGQVDMAQGMVEHFVFEIKHYGKVRYEFSRLVAILIFLV